MKILLMSDTHGEQKRCEQVIRACPGLDLYIHLGDIGFSPLHLRGFNIVRANHDPSSYLLPEQKIIAAAGMRILLIHGHQAELKIWPYLKDSADPFVDMLARSAEALAALALQQGCQAVFHGHTHVFGDVTINGIRLVNPGSLCRGRKGEAGSYALIDVTAGRLRVNRQQLWE